LQFAHEPFALLDAARDPQPSVLERDRHDRYMGRFASGLPTLKLCNAPLKLERSSFRVSYTGSALGRSPATAIE
jgi:hypothetical protein